MSGCRPDHACCHEARALKSEKAALELRVKELEELNAGNVADFLNELNGFKLRAEKAEADLATHHRWMDAVGSGIADLRACPVCHIPWYEAESVAAVKPAARCADCDGMGRNLAHPEEPCPACGGSGRLVVRLNREQAKAFFKVLSDASVDPDDERECTG